MRKFILAILTFSAIAVAAGYFSNPLVSPANAQFGCGGTNLMTTGAGFAGCSGGGFTPAKLSNLIAWWKADAGISNAGLSNMTWADQSGNGYTLSIQQGQPTVTSSCQNGLPCVVSSAGSNSGFNIMITSANAVSLGGASLCAYASVLDAGTGNGYLQSFVASGDTFPDRTTTSSLFRNNASIWFNIRNFVTDGFSSSYAANTWQQVYSVFDGTNANIYVGNVVGTSTGETNTFGATGTVGVMGDKNATGNYVGEVGEIVLQKGCTSTDRSNMQTYFHTRWND